MSPTASPAEKSALSPRDSIPSRCNRRIDSRHAEGNAEDARNRTGPAMTRREREACAGERAAADATRGGEGKRRRRLSDAPALSAIWSGSSAIPNTKRGRRGSPAAAPAPAALPRSARGPQAARPPQRPRKGRFRVNGRRWRDKWRHIRAFDFVTAPEKWPGYD